MAMVGIIVLVVLPVIAIITVGVLALVIFSISKITSKIPLSKNEGFKKVYPIAFGFLFSFLGGAFCGSMVDMITLPSHAIYPYRNSFNDITMLVAFLAGIILLGIFIGFARTHERAHIVLPTILFASLGGTVFLIIWRYAILVVSNMKLTELLFG
jgi:hypothetical protein